MKNELTKEQQVKAYAILVSALDAFKAKAMEYYAGGTAATDKIERGKAIVYALREFEFPFSIAAEEVQNLITGEEDYICPGGMVCVGGVCVPDIGLFQPSEEIS